MQILVFLQDEVWDLAIKPDCQGRGIARELMNFVENYAKENGVKELKVFTRVDNAKNVKIYERVLKRLFIL